MVEKTQRERELELELAEARRELERYRRVYGRLLAYAATWPEVGEALDSSMAAETIRTTIAREP